MMGNIHSCTHRLTALAMACLASAALIFCAFGGFSCSFVQVQATERRNVMTSTGDLFNATVEYFGVLCEDTPFYDESDRLWNFSQLFFYVSLGLGSLTTLWAWTLTICLSPTECVWRSMSISSAITAVLQIPIFLVFESDNCNFDVNLQTCNLAMGAYMNMLSVIIWVIMTVWTQCLKVPKWDRDLNAWKVDIPNSCQSSSTSSGSSDAHRRHNSYNSTETGENEGEEQLYRHRNSKVDRILASETSGQREPPGPVAAKTTANTFGTEKIWTWTSMQNTNSMKSSAPKDLRGSHRSTKGYLRSLSKRIESSGEIKEECIQRDANCMERFLSRKNILKNQQQQTMSDRIHQHLSCSFENDQDMLEEVATTLLDSSLACTTTNAATAVDESFAEQSEDAVRSGAPCHNDFLCPMDTYSSREVPRSKARGGSSKTKKFPHCCPESCISQNLTNLPAAVAAYVLTDCDDCAHEEGEEQRMFEVVAAVPDNSGKKSVRRYSFEKRGKLKEVDENDHENQTNRTDFLTKRLRTGTAKTPESRKKHVAPLNSIHIDTSFIHEDENTDDVSEMTRGSGVASGVSEILDSMRRRCNNNEDPTNILEDLERTY